MPNPEPAVTRRPALILFGALAATVFVVDQVVKQWILAHFQLEVPTQVAGDYVRVTLVHNSGALFGLFGEQAGLFAVVSVAVMAAIVWFEARVGQQSLLLTIALGLLLGGALGNLLDRVRYGYVVDFVDMGLGGWRWYTYNVGDAGISLAIVLLIAVALLPAVDRPARG